jgi:hypothetical protein
VTISSDRAYGFMVALKSVVGMMNSFFKEEKLDPGNYIFFTCLYLEICSVVVAILNF